MNKIELIKHLKRIFPHLHLLNECYIWGVEENECVPEVELDWEDILKILEENGLEIKYKKNK